MCNEYNVRAADNVSAADNVRAACTVCNIWRCDYVHRNIPSLKLTQYLKMDGRDTSSF